MPSTNFPDPNVTPKYTSAGITWTYNFDLGVWSSEDTPSLVAASGVEQLKAGTAISLSPSDGQGIVTVSTTALTSGSPVSLLTNDEAYVSEGDDITLLNNNAGYVTSAGVTQITAGPNIAISPLNGLGVVTISGVVTGPSVVGNLQQVTESGNITTLGAVFQDTLQINAPGGAGTSSAIELNQSGTIAARNYNNGASPYGLFVSKNFSGTVKSQLFDDGTASFDSRVTAETFNGVAIAPGASTGLLNAGAYDNDTDYNRLHTLTYWGDGRLEGYGSYTDSDPNFTINSISGTAHFTGQITCDNSIQAGKTYGTSPQYAYLTSNGALYTYSQADDAVAINIDNPITSTKFQIFSDGRISSGSSAMFVGAVQASGFIGDGSQLTNVALPDFSTLTPLT